MTRYLPFIAGLLYLISAALVTAGAAAVFPPAGLVVGGFALVVWTTVVVVGHRPGEK